MGIAGPSRIRQPVMILCVDPRAEGEMSDTDARLWHPWLRINRDYAAQSWAMTSAWASTVLMALADADALRYAPDGESADRAGRALHGPPPVRRAGGRRRRRDGLDPLRTAGPGWPGGWTRPTVPDDTPPDRLAARVADAIAASVPSRRPGAPCRPRRRRAMVQGRWPPAEGASRG